MQRGNKALRGGKKNKLPQGEPRKGGIYEGAGNSPERTKKNLAATYSPARLQYHRREGVSLPCSGWERVSPPCYGHQEVIQKHIAMRPMTRSESER